MIIIACIIVIIILISYIVYNKYLYYTDFITGIYTGDPDFLDNAKLGEFILYIDYENPKYKGYIILADMNSDPVKNITISGKLTITLSKTPEFKMTIDEENDILPQKLNMTVDPLTGYLTLSDNEKIYAVLVKDMYKSKAALTNIESNT